jgi:transposase
MQTFRSLSLQRYLSCRQQHRAGERLLVDWAGAKIPIHDRETGEVRLASLFVAVLGGSSYTSAEAAVTQELEPWIGAHVRAFEFLGGVPDLTPANRITGDSIAKLVSDVRSNVSPDELRSRPGSF